MVGYAMPKTHAIFYWTHHPICDRIGIPALPHDTTAVDGLACTLPFGVILLSDRGYVSESLRHQLDARYGVTLIIMHRANMLSNTPTEQRLLCPHRTRIETAIINVRRWMWYDSMHDLLSVSHSRLPHHSLL
jgi:hypothetical protein